MSLWGINLLREGLDLPEVSLVAILGRRSTGVPPFRQIARFKTAGRAARKR